MSSTCGATGDVDDTRARNDTNEAGPTVDGKDGCVVRVASLTTQWPPNLPDLPACAWREEVSGFWRLEGEE